MWQWVITILKNKEVQKTLALAGLYLLSKVLDDKEDS